MMNKFLISSLIALLIVLLPGCNSATPMPAIQIPEGFQQTAEAMAENIINGLNKQDYELFSKDFDTKMTAAIPSKAMLEVRKLLWSQYGEFQTMQTNKVFEDKGFFIGIFELTFDKGKITMQVVFSTTEPIKVSGLWFPST